MDWLKEMWEAIKILFGLANDLKGYKRLAAVIFFVLLVLFVVLLLVKTIEPLVFALLVMILVILLVMALVAFTPEMRRTRAAGANRPLFVHVLVHRPGRTTDGVKGATVRVDLRNVTDQTTNEHGRTSFEIPVGNKGKTARFRASFGGTSSPEVPCKIADGLELKIELDVPEILPPPPPKKDEPPEPPQPSPKALRASYLNQVFESCGKLSLAAIDRKDADPQGATQVALNAVYTALLTTTTEEMDRTKPEERPERPDKPRYVPALEQLNQHDRLVLLGDPGSGKSTFVSFVALCLSGALLSRPEANLTILCTPIPVSKDEKAPTQHWDHGPLLPLQVVLRDLVASGCLPSPDQAATIEHLWAFIGSELEKLDLKGFLPHLKNELRESGGILMLDGLDEVSDADQRRPQIKAVVEIFARTYPKCRILVTSRTYAYQRQDWRLNRFQDAVLQSFRPAQIEYFIDRWYAFFAKQGRIDPNTAQGSAEELKRAIDASAGLQEMAARPLLLTLIASLHAWRGGKLPDKRHLLYEETVDLLLDRWSRRLVKRDSQGKVISTLPSLTEWLKVSSDEVKALLARLAYEAHAAQPHPEQGGTADVPQDGLLLGLMNLNPREAVDQRALKDYLVQRAGILLPRGEGVFTFPHRTIQEYLAARHLTQLGYPHKIAGLACHDPLRWREVALLAGAIAGEGAAYALWGLVDALSPETSAEAACPPDRQWGALLAGQALLESGKYGEVEEGDRPKLDRLSKRLVQVVVSGMLPPRERAAAGRALARLGDPRPEVIDVDKMRFCHVPAGPFWLGSEQHYDDEKPVHQVDLPAFWIGLHPVSNAQFQAFVDGGGYASAELWPEARAAGFWSNEGVKMYRDEKPRLAPARARDPFGLPNHPVVNVSWYEALAFTRWLTRRWRDQGWLPEGWRVALPSEAEWEKAARGGLQLPQPAFAPLAVGQMGRDFTPVPGGWAPNPGERREYPWNGPFDPERANTSEGQLGETSPLGCFPLGAGPYGTLDQSGNVWEWTRSLWRGYPYQDFKAREDLAAAPGQARVWRGGGWYDLSGNARCSSRYGLTPDFWNDDLGLRCSLSPDLS